MKILILGAGKMGAFFCDLLYEKYEVAVFETNPKKLKFLYGAYRFSTFEEIRDFMPDLVINAVTVKFTIPAFESVLPYLPKECIISDISSVKNKLPEFYKKSGFRFVSTHPMFGPTFASLNDLSKQNAIIIKESDPMGGAFFNSIYSALNLNIFHYTFEEHDSTMAYSLSVPFVSTFVFTAIMKKQEAPGTTFQRHMKIAKGLLSEDDYLLQEILFNPRSSEQIEQIRTELLRIKKIIDEKDSPEMQRYLKDLRLKL